MVLVVKGGYLPLRSYSGWSGGDEGSFLQGKKEGWMERKLKGDGCALEVGFRWRAKWN